MKFGRELMRSLRSFRFFLVFGYLLVALLAPVQLLAIQQQQGPRPLPPPRYIPSHDYDTQNIKIELRFDWEHEQALGTETISLSQLVTNLRRVDLDAGNITFNSV